MDKSNILMQKRRDKIGDFGHVPQLVAALSLLRTLSNISNFSLKFLVADDQTRRCSSCLECPTL